MTPAVFTNTGANAGEAATGLVEPETLPETEAAGDDGFVLVGSHRLPH
jgi:hypothetical protein